ncbi:MAG: hypothetical protein COX19_04100 [Desulfobacterales bacterium CG23_combo_of_CG06-09_8_20_14_all_51_8]|nr:MAG: hypothetical protein COX19_04100 [Desulfobacterales bacterium CG23_combo_of_CG06-09_8_20_14_all_51_8]
MKFRIQKIQGKFKTISFISVLLLMVLAATDADAERLAVNSSVANVRSGPGTNYEVLWQVEKYTPLQVVDKDKTGDWYYIKDYEGTIGWINRDILDNTDTVITKPLDERCNIRSGPDTKGDVVFKAVKGVPFKVLERKGDWLHVEHADGEGGWVHKTLVW